MALDYFALVMLIVIIAVVVYGVVAVYGVPYQIAKARHHPHQDAIRAATWASLFTLGALWPFLWIWALMYDPERGWGNTVGLASDETSKAMARLDARISALEKTRQEG
ncbi:MULTISPECIES: DUF3302 domain-containing protein [unclassified Hyphomicrobium]|uniref:DUF3302 domain-containing protein n=1 Tax=unclassified Hyphomicrobium TaxID=2619925 RepID=UPI000213F693|nr:MULTISPECIES: DUF3302 domain-containing protein [unclassified Hyphomicrobium]CCB64960.1 conserved protein of unknown function [Hyphomicrobium sp. MC1]